MKDHITFLQNQMPIKQKITYTRTDFYRFFALQFALFSLRGVGVAFCGWFLFLAGGIGFLTGYFSFTNTVSLIVGFIALTPLLPLIVSTLRYQVAMKFSRKSKEFVVELAENHIQITSAISEQKIYWEGITSYRLWKDELLILYLGHGALGGSGILLPQRYFGQIEWKKVKEHIALKVAPSSETAWKHPRASIFLRSCGACILAFISIYLIAIGFKSPTQISKLSSPPKNMQQTSGKGQPEARNWVETNKSTNTPLAGNRFASRDEALDFIDELYEKGAARVSIEDELDEDWRIKEEGGPYATSLLIELPRDQESKDQLFQIYCEELTREFSIDLAIQECLSNVDHTQTHVTLWWD